MLRDFGVFARGLVTKTPVVERDGVARRGAAHSDSTGVSANRREKASVSILGNWDDNFSQENADKGGEWGGGDIVDCSPASV